ncbi:MAG: hypothetical protein JXA82_06240 [Sedimentisphaerales bacterium]|nr:hypothetical protein [Sedimentisphaerales bacterium]
MNKNVQTITRPSNKKRKWMLFILGTGLVTITLVIIATRQSGWDFLKGGKKQPAVDSLSSTPQQQASENTPQPAAPGDPSETQDKLIPATVPVVNSIEPAISNLPAPPTSGDTQIALTEPSQEPVPPAFTEIEQPVVEALIQDSTLPVAHDRMIPETAAAETPSPEKLPTDEHKAEPSKQDHPEKTGEPVLAAAPTKNRDISNKTAFAETETSVDKKEAFVNPPAIPEMLSEQNTKSSSDPLLQKEIGQIARESSSSAINHSVQLDQDCYCSMCELKNRLHEIYPWLDLGADFRFRHIHEETNQLDRKAQGHDKIFQRYRLRTWARIMPDDNTELNFRITGEPRYYFRPDQTEQYTYDEFIFDRMNVTWRNVGDLPLTAVLGRQDIVLGTGWLLQRGTPLDGSRTYFFDAARFTYKLDGQTTADMIYIENHANSSAWIRPFNDQDIDLEEQDARGAILYLSNDTQDRQLDGYLVYKRDHNRNRPNGSEGEIYTLGATIRKPLNPDWDVTVEIAPQFGHKNGKSLSSFATNSYLDRHLHDAINSRIRFGYEYLSGDDDPDQYFDKLWGRANQFSVLYNGPIDSIDGRKDDSSNLHRFSLAYLCEPTEQSDWLAAWHILFADENTYQAGTNGLSEHGTFRGHLLTTQYRIKSNPHLCHRINAELFFPGNYYTDDRNDVALYLRYELLITW